MPAPPNGLHGSPWRNSGITPLPTLLLATRPLKLYMGMYPPRHFGISVLDDVVVLELSTWLQDRQVVTDLILQHLARATDRMKR